MKTILLLLVGSLALCAAEPEKQVTAAMEAFKQALIHRDGVALGRLLHDDLQYTHSGGQFETKADVIKAITSGKSIIEKLEFSDTTVRVYGNTALFKGRVDLYHSATNIVPMNVLHVWVNGPGGWKLVARQATRLPK